MKKILSFFSNTLNKEETIILSLSIFIFSLLRLPSVVEPYWYGDEGVYEVIGKAMRAGRLLYRDIWDNKPPVLYLIYSIFNGDQFYVRLLSIFFGIVSVAAIFLLAKNIFKKRIAVYISCAFFAILFGLPIIEGNIANAENFMLAPILIAFSVALTTKEKNKFITAAAAGVLLSLAFLTKIVAVFDLCALITIIFVLRFHEEISFSGKKAKEELAMAVASLRDEAGIVFFFALPIFFTAAFFLATGAFPDFFRASVSQNVGYVGYANFFIFPMGLLVLKLALLIFSVLMVIRYRRSLGRAGVIVLIWLAFSVFNSFFSSRPYTHYLLVLLPSLSLLLGYVVENKKMLIFSLPLFLLVVVIVSKHFKINYNFLPYYSNYFAFLGGEPVERYQAFFDKKTPRDYDLANFIKSKTDDTQNVFLWSDSPQIYALAGKIPPGRYVVAYHITFYKNAIDETHRAIEKNNVKYIIQTKEGSDIDNFTSNYVLRYKMGDVNIYERQP